LIIQSAEVEAAVDDVSQEFLVETESLDGSLLSGDFRADDEEPTGGVSKVMMSVGRGSPRYSRWEVSAFGGGDKINFQRR
jgi:hypothetical protein